MAVDKLTAMLRQAVAMDIADACDKDNLLRRVELAELDSEIDRYRCTCGYFTKYNAESLDELDKIIKNKYQTRAYYGYIEAELKGLV